MTDALLARHLWVCRIDDILISRAVLFRKQTACSTPRRSVRTAAESDTVFVVPRTLCQSPALVGEAQQ
jgi:hypothetical protein